MAPWSVFAQAFQYPHPGNVDKLEKDAQNASDASGSKAFAKFIAAVKPLSLAEHEELYTRTLDLSPLSAPYVGHQIWGESYKRGEFMAQLNKEMKAYQIDLEGELPDHLRPVLQYLTASPTPLPELIEVLDQAVEAMHKSLMKTEADNPYLLLFEAISMTCKSLTIES